MNSRVRIPALVRGESLPLHPNREVLDRRRAHGATILRTDQDGLITIRSDGRKLQVETNRDLRGSSVTPAW